MYFKMTRAAVTVVGGAAALCLGSVPAALASGTQDTTFVPCNAYALWEAINYGNSHSGETLDLAPGCTYYLPHALPEVQTDLTIMGYHSTLTRTRDAGSFSLLKVGGLGCGGGGGGVNIPAGNANLDNQINECKADLTVINLSFGDGGGDIDAGGAIYNAGGTLNVHDGVFSDNTTDEEGGAIYNDGYMTLSNGTFSGNVSPYGGAIDNVGDATIKESSFTWNKAPTLSGDPDNSSGGAIYNDYDLDITDSGFVANSTGGYGGAIDNEDHLTAWHITVTANEADFDGGGIYNDDETTSLFGSFVFGNQPDNCFDVQGC
jgi:predicted outer membrane repeat protein